MQRTIAVLLAVLLAAAMAGCAGKSVNYNPNLRRCPAGFSLNR